MYFVTYSPRGFRNELAVRAFSSISEARDFRAEINNDVNAWAESGTSDLHKSTIARYRRAESRGELLDGDAATTAWYYYYQA